MFHPSTVCLIFHSVGKGGVPEEDEEVEEESDMSDSEADDEPVVAEDPASDGMPLGTTFRNLQPQPPRNSSSSWIPRKLSQISHGGTSSAASNKTKAKGQGGRVTHASSDNRPSGAAEEEGEEADETTPLRSDCQTGMVTKTAKRLQSRKENRTDFEDETSRYEYEPYVLEVQFCLVFVVHKTMIDF